MGMGCIVIAAVHCNRLVLAYPGYPLTSDFGIPALSNLMCRGFRSVTSVYGNGLFQFSRHNMRGGFTERAR